MVEAVSPAQAVQHVVGQEITELRVARPAEILAWTRANKPIALAGVKPVQAPLLDDDPEFNASDARVWLIERFAGLDQAADALKVFDAMRESGAMSLDQFEEMRALSGEFVLALGGWPLDTTEAVDLADMSNRLATEPFPFDEVVRLIGEAKRRELFKPE